MKRKRRLQNLVMIAIILLVAAGGILAAGSVRGWFAHEGDAAILADVRGIVRVQRSGVSYPLEEETVLRSGDQLVCDAGTTAVIRLDGGELTLGGNAELMILDPAAETFSARVDFGEVFADLEKRAELSFEARELELENCVALLSVRSGAQTLSVFDGTAQSASAGQKIDWLGTSQSVGEISISSLNDFAMVQIRAANQTRALCVTNEALDELQAQRSAAISEQLSSGDADGLSCSIAIYCDTILDNWDALDTAKASYVPSDGVILAPTQVSFESGETVFDVLTRVCEACEIQIEYSWTPLYDSYYIEGIHQLYEFDCGPQSGWMYKVNEWFPNYGCSAYKLTGGESIVWCYTCVGLGADVGGDAY